MFKVLGTSTSDNEGLGLTWAHLAVKHVRSLSLRRGYRELIKRRGCQLIALLCNVRSNSCSPRARLPSMKREIKTILGKIWDFGNTRNLLIAKDFRGGS